MFWIWMRGDEVAVVVRSRMAVGRRRRRNIVGGGLAGWFLVWCV